MFPLTDESREMGYLPLMNKAWELTPNPWWRFVTDIPASLAPPPSSSSSSETRSSMQLSERSLTKTEKGWMDSMISVKKILQDKPVECYMKGSLHKMKMIQFVKAKIGGTILTKTSIEVMGIVHHSINLFHGSLVKKAKVMGVWILRDTEDSSSLVSLDINPCLTMNILIWNCRGAMKPQFRKMVMDLVE